MVGGLAWTLVPPVFPAAEVDWSRDAAGLRRRDAVTLENTDPQKTDPKSAAVADEAVPARTDVVAEDPFNPAAQDPFNTSRRDLFETATHSIQRQRRSADAVPDSVRVSWNDLLLLSRQLLAAGDNAPDDLRKRYEDAYARFQATSGAKKNP